MQVFLIILCRKIIFWLLSSPFPILFLSFSYLQYNNKPKSQENASVLSKNLLKMLTKGGKKLATNSHLISSILHFSPQFPTLSFFATYLIFPCFKSLIQELVLYSYTKIWYNQELRNSQKFRKLPEEVYLLYLFASKISSTNSSTELA